jgi:hypothetical protein
MGYWRGASEQSPRASFVSNAFRNAVLLKDAQCKRFVSGPRDETAMG